MRIQNNTAAFNVWTSYTSNVNNMKSAMSHLSTGLKTVVDDPAGVGISERMRAQADGTSMARSNVENGISLIQTADSWLQKVNDMLSRMSELSIEANDGTKSATDKANVQTEFKQMQEEITRITSKYTAAGKFNGLYLFRGGNGVAQMTNGDNVDTSTNGFKIQVGADIDQTIDVSLKDLQVTNTQTIGSVITFGYNSSHVITSSSRVGVQWASIVDVNKMSVASSEAVGKIATAIDHIANARAELGAQQKRMEQTRDALLSYEDNIRAAESKIRDIDMASESTNFTKYQILTQASNAMLAQANSLPQGVLSLLG